MRNNSKVTVTTLAKMSGVSRATVSRVLNDNGSVNAKAREKVLAAIKASGYTRPSAKIKINLKFTRVTIICEELNPFLSGSFLDMILHAIRSEAEHLGINCEFVGHETIDDKERFKEILHDSEAIMMIGSSNAKVLETVRKAERPVVIVNGNDPSLSVSSISPDSEMGGFLLGNYLIDRGHTKACMLNAHIKHSTFERSDGFRRAFEMRGIEFDERRQIIDLKKIALQADPSGEFLKELNNLEAGVDFGAHRVLPYLLDNGYFEGMTAVACVCDATAISLYKALSARGIRVPEDISITGFDDIALSSMLQPSLTTINLDFHHLAHTAFLILIRTASGLITRPSRTQTAVKLIERHSVRKLS